MADDSPGTPHETAPSTASTPSGSPCSSGQAMSPGGAPGTGSPPSRVRPTSLAETAAALEAAASEQQSLLFTGAGTALQWGAPVSRTDLVVETTGLDRLVSHAPEDWTVGVEAGMPLAQLQQLLAPAGQWLPLDAPTERAGATLGGLLAGGDAGPRRLKYGGLSDLVIGATLVMADGSVVRTGGDVIKNVAGYDLAKLMAGSLGAFGLVAQLNLRVHPLPESTATLALETADATQALVAARAVMRSPLEPVAVEWDGKQLLVRFHGTEDSTASRGQLGTALPELAGARVLDAEGEHAAWARMAALVAGEEGETVLRAGTRPAQLPALHAQLHALTEGTGVEAMLVSGVAQGVHTVVLRGGDPEEHAACLTAWREAVHESGGSVTLRRRLEGVDAVADSWGPAPPTTPVLRALKRQFDPDERCARGRFAPWF